MRRLTRDTVWIWIATRTASRLTLTVRTKDAAGSVTEVTTNSEPFRFGKNLYLALLKATWDGGFEPNKTYTYTVTSTSADPVWKGTDLGLLPNHTTDPSFLGVPDRLGQARLAHASCLKLHGLGRDALAAYTATLTSFTRPHLLLLTGDQIYADDVGGPLMPRVRSIATELVGWTDTFWHQDLRTFGQQDKRGMPPVCGRQEITAGSPDDRRLRTGQGWGFTSDCAGNHAWTLGEFFALYLLAWSDVLWPKEFRPITGLVPEESDRAGRLGTGWEDRCESWEQDRGRLESTRVDRIWLRRLLANTPTLMVLDDHEVTDDFNLDQAWATRVYGKDKAGVVNDHGRRVVANGLGAYLLFQHWGNDPDAFAPSDGPASRALTALKHPGSPPVPADEPTAKGDLQVWLGLPSAEAPAVMPSTGRVDYHLLLEPGEPWPFRLLLLDERTRRSYNDHHEETAVPAAVPDSVPDPSRMSRVGKDALAWIPTPGVGESAVTVVVAPAPVFGSPLHEHWVSPVGSVFSGLYAMDLESWDWNPKAREDLLARLAAYQKVVILSGDLHYAFTNQVDYTRGTTTARMVQFVASSTRNADPMTVLLHVSGALQRQLGMLRERTFHGWTAKPDATAPATRPRIPWDDAAELLSGRVELAVAQGDYLVPKEVAAWSGIHDPHWTWTLTPKPDLPPPPPPPPSWVDWKEGSSIDTVTALSNDAKQQVGTVVVGLPNVGALRFSGSGVTQVLHCAAGPGPVPIPVTVPATTTLTVTCTWTAGG